MTWYTAMCLIHKWKVAEDCEDVSIGTLPYYQLEKWFSVMNWRVGRSHCGQEIQSDLSDTSFFLEAGAEMAQSTLFYISWLPRSMHQPFFTLATRSPSKCSLYNAVITQVLLLWSSCHSKFNQGISIPFGKQMSPWDYSWMKSVISQGNEWIRVTAFSVSDHKESDLQVTKIFV